MSVTDDTAQSAAPTSNNVPQRSRRRLGLAAAAVVVLALVAGGVFWARGREPTAPYADAAATGRLALCTADGAAVTSGSVDDALPAQVVGATTQPADAGAAAVTLFAYQPRQGVDAVEWSGIALTAADTVEAGEKPELATGPGGLTIAQFLGGYPATWDGWVQLRLLRGTTDGTDTTSYDTLDLHISGDHWQAIASGDCAA